MNNTVLEFDVPMRDGVSLYTLVQIPEGRDPGDRLPIVLKRNPYVSKDVDLGFFRGEDTHGYAVVTQHCRGCGRSGGDCVPYDFERADGLDTLDWIRAQPFYCGEIYLFGVSYLSSVHFAYLDTNPPDVKGAVLCVQDTERYNCVFRNGVYKIGLAGCWSLGMFRKNTPTDAEKPIVPEMFRTLPLAGMTRHVFGEPAPAIEESFRHPESGDPYWASPAGGSDYRRALSASTMPVLLVTSFYDIYTQGILEMWDRLPAERRANCALLVTPFDHDFNPSPDRKFPEGCGFPDGRLADAIPAFDYNWFDAVRGGRLHGLVHPGETTFYRLFEDRWHSAPRVADGPREFRLHLNTGRKLDASPCEPAEIRYRYNPFAPASFPGGVCNNFGGMLPQDPPNSRFDIVSFVSGPLAVDTVFEGGIECELHVRSEAPDTGFYVRVDLVRDGVALSLRDDICHLRHFHPDYEPGAEAVIRFLMAPHSFLARKGDCIRVDVSSSCMPHFVPHTNRAGLYCDQTGADPTVNTILTGKSFLVLHALA